MLANTRTERGFVLLLFSFCLASSTVGQRDLTQEGCGGLPESSPLRIQKADGQETMVAGRNIHRGELILSIPWRCVMSVEQVATELGGLLGSRVRLFAEREFQVERLLDRRARSMTAAAGLAARVCVQR
eukprot:766885-Hanusia_phi.AAC.5